MSALRDPDRDLKVARMNAGLMTTTVMTAVVVFLGGALLAAGPDDTAPALMLLAASGLGFVLATLLYANTYALLRKPEELERFDKQMHHANVVSDCIGVYCLLLAVPVALATVTDQRSVSWFAAGASAVTVIAYHASGASLVHLYLKHHPNKRVRQHRVAITVVFTCVTLFVALWVVLAVQGIRGSPTTATYVFIGLLIAASVCAAVAPPVLGPTGTTAVTATSGTTESSRRPSPSAVIVNSFNSWGRRTRGLGALSALLAVLAATTVAAIIFGVVNQDSANASARHIQREAVSAALRLQRRAQRARRRAVVTAGESTAEAFAARVHEAENGLHALLRTDRELPPAIQLSGLASSVADGVALLSTDAAPAVLKDLSNFRGQMRITYDNFHRAREHGRLSHRDHLRICRTINSGRTVEQALARVPGVDPATLDTPPRSCPHIPA